MPLAASIQITDQDIYQQVSVKGAEGIGQIASTPGGKVFAYSNAGGTLAAGQITTDVAVTANYATRTLTTAAALGASSVTIPLGTTATADQFAGFFFVVTDGTGKGQGAYGVNGNTAATSGNSNTTTINLGQQQLTAALDTTSVVGLYPNPENAVVQHTASATVPTVGAPTIAVTSGNYFWNQVHGYASVLSDGIISKNAGAIASASVAGAVTIEATTTITQRVGFAPEATVDTKYSPLVLTLLGF